MNQQRIHRCIQRCQRKFFFHKCLYSIIFPVHFGRVVITLPTAIGKIDTLLTGALYQAFENLLSSMAFDWQKCQKPFTGPADLTYLTVKQSFLVNNVRVESSDMEKYLTSFSPLTIISSAAFPNILTTSLQMVFD